MAGGFGSTVDKYVDETFRNSSYEHSFYPKALKTKGKEAAEAELRKWVEASHLYPVADALPPIVMGLSRLLEVEPNVPVKKFGYTNHSFFPFPCGVSEDCYGIAVKNPEVRTQSKGTDVFSPWGELGITSFVVVIDPLWPECNSVVLMLPIRDDEKGTENRHGFVAVILDRKGRMTSELHELYFYKQGAQNFAFGAGRPFEIQKSSGGRPCSQVGFPGAREFIASRLGYSLSTCRMLPTSWASSTSTEY